MTAAWSGRRVRVLVDRTLHRLGTTCHLCGLDGADSADHDPPRSILLAACMPDPDADEYLFPAHRLPCNVRRRDRPVTDELRAECRTARLAYIGHDPAVERAQLSPRFARVDLDL